MRAADGPAGPERPLRGITGGSDPITLSEFTAFYPQFAGFTPAIVVSAYLDQANARFSSFTREDAEEARRLYVAHKLTRYAGTALPEGRSPAKEQLAAAGQGQQRIATKKAEEVSVAYATGASSAVYTGLADLQETSYGLELLSLVRLYARSAYVP